MAWTNWGFDGTINEAQWAQMAGLLGNGYVAAGNGDCLVTAVGGARSVSVAAGTLYGDGVVSVNSAPETVAMTTPVNGQWYVIALRRTWATNTAALVAIAGATTTTTTPTAPPTSFPTLNSNVGVLTDQPIAWAWCNSANTTVVVYDIRLKAVKSLPPVVANANERDAKFMTPTQGLQVWRDDLGAVETYYGLYNSSTNPGGRDAAGWYTTNRAGGLVPIRPASVDKSGGTATASALGIIDFSGVSSVSLNNVFTSAFSNYRIIVQFFGSVDNAAAYLRLRASGADYSSTSYYFGGWYVRPSGANGAWASGGNGASNWDIGRLRTTSALRSNAIVDIQNPQKTLNTTMTENAHIEDITSGLSIFQSGTCAVTNSFDGLSIFPSSGTISGNIQVFGYNN